MLYYSPKLILKTMLVCILIISLLFVVSQAILHYLPHTGTIKKSFLFLFDMDRELSISTWFNQMLLGTAGFIGLLVAYCSRLKNKLSPTWGYWLSLGLLFVYLSIDEGASIHELFMPVVQRFMGDLSGTPLAFSWVVLGAAFLLLVAAVYARFIFRLPNRTTSLLLLSAAAYVSAVIGFEMIGGFYATTVGADFGYSLIVLMEESLEMIGISVYIYALLDYSRQHDFKLTIARQL